MGLSLINFAREVWKFGTHERAARGTPLNLGVYSSGGAGITYSTARLSGAAAGYQVAAGRTLVLTRLVYRCTAANDSFGVGYSDADLGLSAGADGANAVNLTLFSDMRRGVWAAGVVTVVYDVSVYYEVPAGKYLRTVSPAGAGELFCEFLGYEV